MTLQNNTAPAGLFSFAIKGTVTVPFHVATLDPLTVPPMGTYVFPPTPAGAPISRGFFIYNDGTSTLTIYNSTTLVSSQGGFSQIQDAPATISPGTNGSFRVRLLSSATGSYTGVVSIQSSAGTFAFNLSGVVQ